MMDKVKSIPVYNSEVSVDSFPSGALDADPVAVVGLLVAAFVRSESFESNSDALQYTNEDEWNEQLNRAAHLLEERLFKVLETASTQLHNGRFAR